MPHRLRSWNPTAQGSELQWRLPSLALRWVGLLLIALPLAACGREVAPTARAALWDDIGYLRGEAEDNPTVQSIERSVPDGVVVAYRWQEGANGPFCGAATHVVRLRRGWASEASFAMGCDAGVAQGFVGGRGPNSAEQGFSSAYGFATRGQRVRITWEDGRTSETPLERGLFLAVRDGDFVLPTRFELLAADGSVLEVADSSSR